MKVVANSIKPWLGGGELTGRIGLALQVRVTGLSAVAAGVHFDSMVFMTPMSDPEYSCRLMSASHAQRARVHVFSRLQLSEWNLSFLCAQHH